ncbi:hypothetical protein ABZV93_18920 [Actinopolymorpha sp. NPDC004070]|uniref:hypothetical protein n=1 Tax=Actinopolymorpha sp. NPDC004070 TaxID=3154548 RepID=UPI0033BAA5CF
MGASTGRGRRGAAAGERATAIMIDCDLCGTTAPGAVPPLGWVVSRERGSVQHYCDRCARENVRNIECRLERSYW